MDSENAKRGWTDELKKWACSDEVYEAFALDYRHAPHRYVNLATRRLRPGGDQYGRPIAILREEGEDVLADLIQALPCEALEVAKFGTWEVCCTPPGSRVHWRCYRVLAGWQVGEWVDPDQGPATDPLPDAAIGDLAEELDRAQQEYLGETNLIDALGIALGKAARAGGRCIEPGLREWLSVAVVAMRLYQEGSPRTDSAVIDLLWATEAVGRDRRKEDDQ